MENDDTRNMRVRMSLIQKRDALLKEARSDISKCLSGEKYDVAKSGDDGDRSVASSSEDVSFRNLAQNSAHIKMIEGALLKLDSGTYGICEECGEEIPEGRLRAMPFALYCRDCQELIEQRQKAVGHTAFDED